MQKLTLVALAVAMSVVATGCKKKTTTNTATPPAETPKITLDTNDASDVRTGLPDPVESTVLGTIFFEFDAAALTEEAKATLRQNAETLKEHATVTVRLEGHADERGSTQYNLALGEKRATAVREYLATLGVAVSRLEVVSYGEEKPSDAGHEDTSYAKNRRVELAVTAGGDRVSSSYR